MLELYKFSTRPLDSGPFRELQFTEMELVQGVYPNMPVYAYRCQECEHGFEVKQSFTEDPLTDCPKCNTAGSVVRVIQPAGVVFKGSGFYVTDSRSNRSNLTGTSNGNGSSDTNGSSSNGSTNGHAKDNGNSAKAETSSAEAASPNS